MLETAGNDQPRRKSTSRLKLNNRIYNSPKWKDLYIFYYTHSIVTYSPTMHSMNAKDSIPLAAEPDFRHFTFIT